MKTLMVKKNEWLRVGYFCCLFFIISAGLAIGRGTADALFLKRFGIAGWETLTRGEASEILDREFAALDKERERRTSGKHAKRTMKAGAAIQTRKGAHHHVNP